MSNFRGSLDANVLLRMMVKDDLFQYRAAKKLIDKSGGQLAVADTAIIEAAFVLRREYGLTRQDVKTAIQDLMLLPQLNCNRVLFDRALTLYASTRGVSLEDCALTVYAELNGALPLYTFDKKLAKSSKNAALVGA
jgi:predicted nucleic-acid-binding protein